MIMAKKSSKIGVGSVIEDFTLISYDEDTGKMLILKNLGNGSKWLEPARTRGSSRALKCGLANWYMKHGGDENRKRVLAR